MRAAASRTFWTAGSKRPMRMAMMAMTTSSSISVKPFGLNRIRVMPVSFKDEEQDRATKGTIVRMRSPASSPRVPGNGLGRVVTYNDGVRFLLETNEEGVRASRENPEKVPDALLIHESSCVYFYW